MAQDIIIRILLFPFSVVYGVVIAIRNALYRWGVLRSTQFDMPIISVGNLSMGGTGKTPHLEYLIRWLHQFLEISTLSRGYGRKTIGFREVFPHDSAENSGDEPLQYRRKFPDVPVCVSESRALAVPEILRRYPQTQCVLLDDAFQHLAIRPGLNILLTEYNRPFSRDWLLPTGRLREWRSGYQRAHIIVVTKCPEALSVVDRVKMLAEINPFSRQKVFFSKYRYGIAYHIGQPEVLEPLSLEMDALLISAIANTDYLLEYLRQKLRSIHTLEFEDHHYFTEDDVELMIRRFQYIETPRRILLTTEKDAVRLEPHLYQFAKHDITVLVLPIEVVFLDGDEIGFQKEVREFLLGFKV